MHLACFLNLPLPGLCSKDIQPPLTTVSRPDNRRARVSSQCHPDSLYHPTSLILSFAFGMWGRRLFLAPWRYKGEEKKGLDKASPQGRGLHAEVPGKAFAICPCLGTNVRSQGSMARYVKGTLTHFVVSSLARWFRFWCPRTSFRFSFIHILHARCGPGLSCVTHTYTAF